MELATLVTLDIYVESTYCSMIECFNLNTGVVNKIFDPKMSQLFENIIGYMILKVLCHFLVPKITIQMLSIKEMFFGVRLFCNRRTLLWQCISSEIRRSRFKKPSAWVLNINYIGFFDPNLRSLITLLKLRKTILWYCVISFDIASLTLCTDSLLRYIFSLLNTHCFEPKAHTNNVPTYIVSLDFRLIFSFPGWGWQLAHYLDRDFCEIETNRSSSSPFPNNFLRLIENTHSLKCSA